MSDNVIKIGTALKWRGAYDPSATYYIENIISACSCIFMCNENGVSGNPPVIYNKLKGEYEYVITPQWTVILDNLEAYNRFIDGTARSINRLKGLNCELPLTENDTIEEITKLDNSKYSLRLKRKWEDYYTSLTPGTIIKGVYNILGKSALDGDETPPIYENSDTEHEIINPDGENKNAYYESWMLVEAVDAQSNTIQVSLYDNTDVPLGINHLPIEQMYIARWGHIDPLSGKQSLLYLSSSNGSITLLQNVDSPIITDDNLAVNIGTIPPSVFEYLNSKDDSITPNQQIFYAKKIAANEIYKLPNENGELPIEYVDRGLYDSDSTYYFKEVNEDRNVWAWEISDVWYTGCKWRCQINNPTSAPTWNNPEWQMIEGNPEFTINFIEEESFYDPDYPDIRLTLTANLYGQCIIDDIQTENIEWSRITENSEGIIQEEADRYWKQAFDQGVTNGVINPKSIKLGRDDCGITGSYKPTRTTFICTVTLPNTSTCATIECNI